MQILIIVLGVASLLLALFITMGIKRLPPGTVTMQEYLSYIDNITGAFINKHYIVAAGLALVAFFIITFLFNIPMAISFLCGVLVSILLLNRIMDIILKSGIRTAATGNSTDKALAVMLCGSLVSAILVMALILLGCGLLFLAKGNPTTINLFLLGIGMVALLYSTGSSIFSSTVNKTETSYLLPAGAIAIDLFESCAVALVGAITVGTLGMARFGFGGVLLPLLIFSAGLVACTLVLILVIIYRQQGLGKITGKAIILYTLFLIVFSLIVTRYLLPGEQLKIFLKVVLGSGLALLLFVLPGFGIPSIFNTNDSNDFWNRYYPVICIPVLFLVLFLSYRSAGLYGVSITGLAILVFAGIAVFIQSFTQINFLSAGLTAGDMDKTDTPGEKDHDYNETAVTNFSIASTAFVAIILLLIFIQVARVEEICTITNWLVLVGLIIGGVLPYLFTSWVDSSARVQQNTDDNGGSDDGLEREVEIQESQITKDYNIYACRESLLVLLAAAAIPLLTGFLLGKQVLTALLIGTTIAGILLVIVRAKNYEPHLSILIKFLLILSLSIAAPLL